MIKTLTVATAALAFMATLADARPRHSARAFTTEQAQVVAHPTGCPRVRFCGCGVSVKVFGHPRRDLFRAASWRKFPRAAPAPGMVAVWGSRHVAYIISVQGNDALLYDPNSGGHLTRIHTRQLPGLVVNPNG